MVTETDQRQFAPACERNQGPILEVLDKQLAGCRRVLELASETGDAPALANKGD